MGCYSLSAMQVEVAMHNTPAKVTCLLIPPFHDPNAIRVRWW